MEVTVEGSIGCGKSTLLSALRRARYEVVLEPVASWDAVFKSFYAEPKKYAALMQGLALCSFLRTGPSLARGIKLYERSAPACLHVFGELLGEDGSMDAVQMDAFRRMFESMKPHLVMPRVCIYVHLDPETCLERMRWRGRDAEEIVSEDYLRRLHARYVGFVLEGRVREEDIRFGRQEFAHSWFSEVYVLDGRESRERIAKLAMDILERLIK
jgi:deoxyadenosine/deoxycytidine kinase